MAWRQATSGPKRLRATAERAELQDVRRVLDVEDCDDIPAGHGESEVEGLRFRPGLARRDDDQLELGPGVNVAQGLKRLLVVLLDQEQHFESVGGVLEPTDVLDQLADDGCFAIGGDHHRIEGQVGVRHPQGFLVAHLLHGMAPDGT